MRLRVISFAILGCHLIAQGEPPANGVEPCLEWLQAHDYPDLSRAEFVRITTGEQVDHGFLLTATADEATVLTADCLETTLRRADGTSWQAASFDQFLRDRLRQWQADPGAFSLRRSPVPTPSHATGFLLLACAAEQRGARARTAQLTGIATRLYGDHRKQLPELLADDLTRVALWQLVLDYARPELSWQELQRRCGAFVSRFADCRLRASAERMQQVTARMLETQQARAAAAGPQDPLAALVHELREQRGTPGATAGQFDIFADPRGSDSPAGRLAAAGDAAIPHLLPALELDDLTRCVAFHRPTFFSHRVMTVGEVARQVFERITGYPPRGRVDAERWWRDYEARGPEAVFADGALAGNVEHARRLLELNQDLALAVLSSALLTLPLDQHAALLEVLSSVADDQATELLRGHLRESADGKAILIAGAALCMRGHVDEALTGLIKAWQSRAPKKALPEIARFLAASGRRSALAAVFDQPERLDQAMFEMLASGEHWPVVTLRVGRAGAGKTIEWTHEAFEDGWLTDLELRLGAIVDSGRFDLRIHAAKTMAARWPDVYAFDADAPAEQLKVALAAIRATWKERTEK